MPASSAAAPLLADTPTGESRTALVRRARRIDRVLAETYPDAHCELDFTTPLELLVATILSAQSTDRRVNGVTPALFARFPDAAAYAWLARSRASMPRGLTPSDTSFARRVASVSFAIYARIGSLT